MKQLFSGVLALILIILTNAVSFFGFLWRKITDRTILDLDHKPTRYVQERLTSRLFYRERMASDGLGPLDFNYFKSTLIYLGRSKDFEFGVAMNRSFFRIDNSYYLKQYKVPFDPTKEDSTFEGNEKIITASRTYFIWSPKNSIYYSADTKSLRYTGPLFTMLSQDSKQLEVCGKSENYAIDKESVYDLHGRHIVEGADPNTFENVEYSNYYTDKNKIFFEGKAIAGSTAEQAGTLATGLANFTYGQSHSNMNAFSYYFRDKNFIYHNGAPINADIASFCLRKNTDEEDLNPEWDAEDRSSYFLQGKAVKNKI